MEWGEQKRNTIRAFFFVYMYAYVCVVDSTFFLLSNFFSPFTSGFVFVQAEICARRLFPRCLPQGDRARGDPDREIVGIRGVTRGDLVLVHNGSICLRSSCRTRTSSSARVIILSGFSKLIHIHIGKIFRENFLCELQNINKCALYANNSFLR